MDMSQRLVEWMLRDAPQQWRRHPIARLNAMFKGLGIPTAALIGVAAFVLMVLVWSAIGVFAFMSKGRPSAADLHYAGGALFFSLVTAYSIGASIVLAERSIRYLDALRPHLPERIGNSLRDDAALRIGLEGAPKGLTLLMFVAGVAFGLALSFAYDTPMEPSFVDMLARPTDHTLVQWALPLHAMLMWAVLFPMFFHMIKTAVLFGALGQVVDIDLLDPDRLKPFGRLASINISVMLMGLGCAPLLWLGEKARWADIVVILLLVLPVTLLLFLLPVRSVAARLKEAKRHELDRLNGVIVSGRRDALAQCSIHSDQEHFHLPELLAWRHELEHLPVLPGTSKGLVEVVTHAVAALVVSGVLWVVSFGKVVLPH